MHFKQWKINARVLNINVPILFRIVFFSFCSISSLLLLSVLPFFLYLLFVCRLRALALLWSIFFRFCWWCACVWVCVLFWWLSIPLKFSEHGHITSNAHNSLRTLAVCTLLFANQRSLIAFNVVFVVGLFFTFRV